MSIAIIADKYLATGFRLTGVHAFPVRNVEEAVGKLREIIAEDKYKVVLVPERFATRLREEREKLVEGVKVHPVLAMIPGFEGPTGERVGELYKLISQAVGARLKLEG
ncbi:MAG: V-type ATP synthase subunit F [Candidatus Geothermarchaeales archaeon]